MGCGSSTPAITHNISLHIINLNKFSEDEAEVVEVSKEVCKIKPKFNVIHYAYSSPILKFKDLFKDPKTIKGSAFLLYYHAQKEKQILNYSQCFQVVPYDEMMLIDAQKLLERIYILDTRTVSSLDMKLDDVLAQLDSDYEVVTRKIKINTAAQENEQNLERRNSVLNEFTQEEKEDETDQVSIIDEDSGTLIK